MEPETTTMLYKWESFNVKSHFITRTEDSIFSISNVFDPFGDDLFIRPELFNHTIFTIIEKRHFLELRPFDYLVALHKI